MRSALWTQLQYKELHYYHRAISWADDFVQSSLVIMGKIRKQTIFNEEKTHCASNLPDLNKVTFFRTLSSTNSRKIVVAHQHIKYLQLHIYV